MGCPYPDGDLEELTPKQKSGRLSSINRRNRERWYLSFKCKNSYDPATGKYIRYVWPILFKDEVLAWEAIRVLPIFSNTAATADRGRIVSVSVEKVMLK